MHGAGSDGTEYNPLHALASIRNDDEELGVGATGPLATGAATGYATGQVGSPNSSAEAGQHQARLPRADGVSAPAGQDEDETPRFLGGILLEAARCEDEGG